MEPDDPPAADDGLTDEERATLAAGGRLVAEDEQTDEGTPRIEGPNPA